MPWQLKSNERRYRFQVGKWVGLVDWWEGTPTGNWALWHGDDLIANDVAQTVDLGRYAVEDAYHEALLYPPAQPSG